MKSALPKVLQTLAGRPLLEHVLVTANQLVAKAKTKPIIVIGHGGASISAYLEQIQKDHPGVADAVTVMQKEQKGSGHALLQALP